MYTAGHRQAGCNTTEVFCVCTVTAALHASELESMLLPITGSKDLAIAAKDRLHLKMPTKAASHCCVMLAFEAGTAFLAPAMAGWVALRTVMSCMGWASPAGLGTESIGLRFSQKALANGEAVVGLRHGPHELPRYVHEHVCRQVQVCILEV